MVTVFRDLEVSREPMAALLLFQEAARRETATVELANIRVAPVHSSGGPRQSSQYTSVSASQKSVSSPPLA
jgi:hypothetical protein